MIFKMWQTANPNSIDLLMSHIAFVILLEIQVSEDGFPLIKIGLGTHHGD